MKVTGNTNLITGGGSGMAVAWHKLSTLSENHVIIAGA